MHVKTSKIHYGTLTEMAKIKKFDIVGVSKDVKALKLIYSWWEYKVIQLFKLFDSSFTK